MKTFVIALTLAIASGTALAGNDYWTNINDSFALPNPAQYRMVQDEYWVNVINSFDIMLTAPEPRLLALSRQC